MNTNHCLVYGRVSTDMQDMQRQEHALELYCQYHHLELLAPPLYDPAVSGSVPFADRDAGARLLSLLAPGVAVVTTEQDRIGRDTIDQIQTIRTIWEAGAVIHFAAEGGALERTPENEMKMELRASIAQYERNKIKQRINDKFSAKRAAGELCGTVPYGFDAEPTGNVTAKGKALFRLVDNPYEQKWILHMKALRDSGMGYHSIAKDLNSRDVPTKRGAGEIMNLRTSEGRANQEARRFTTGRWQAGNVAKVLNNKTVSAWLASHAVDQAA